MSIARTKYKVLSKLPLCKFVELFGESIGYFTLTHRYYTDTNKNRFRKQSDNVEAIERQLADHKIMEFSTTEWYCMHTVYPIDILIYRYNENSVEVLCRFIDTIDLGKVGNLILDIPEDICFFRNDRTLLLGSVSHESIVDLYLTQHEKSITDLPEEFTETPLGNENYNIELFYNGFTQEHSY